MSGIICITILTAITILVILLHKDIFSPPVIVSLEWFVIVFLYNFIDHGLYDISSKTYIIIFLWVLIFTFSSTLSIKMHYTNKLCILNPKDNSSEKLLYIPLLICNYLLVVCELYYFGFSLSLIRIALIETVIPFHIKLLMYINNFSKLYFIYAFFSNSLSKRKLYLLGISIIIAGVFVTNKTVFFSFFLTTLFLLNNKKNLTLKKFSTIVFFTIAALILITYLRGDVASNATSNLFNYILSYLLAPLTAFDQISKKLISIDDINNTGRYTFVFIYRILAIFSDQYRTTIFGPWIKVPVLTNVYTTFAPSYIDFGITGIIAMGFIQGLFWGIIYKLSKRNILIFKMIYAYAIYFLALQFFSDYFSYSFSVLVQTIIFSFLLTKMKRIKF